MAGCALFAGAARAQGQHDEIPHVDDLRALAEQVRRARVPLLLFFSTPGCPYCREVRSGYLAPRLREGSKDAFIREVDILSKRSVVGLDGARLTESELAHRFGVRAVPVVQLVDAELKPLGKPLIGISAAGFYEGLLSAAIDEAGQMLRAR